jgi:hypothetical protein
MMRLRLDRLRADKRGNTIIEFAIVAPVMMMLIMGLGDLLHQIYAQSILDGAIQKAARDSAIQGGANQTSTIDARVVSSVGDIVPGYTYTSSRKFYTSFALVKPETFNDADGDGVRDPGECFDDVNGNGVWDADPGRTGQGGANDVTKYAIAITYPRLFPVAQLLGFSATQTIRAQTLLKNQPYATQTVPTVPSICT